MVNTSGSPWRTEFDTTSPPLDLATQRRGCNSSRTRSRNPKGLIAKILASGDAIRGHGERDGRTHHADDRPLARTGEAGPSTGPRGPGRAGLPAGAAGRSFTRPCLVFARSGLPRTRKSAGPSGRCNRPSNSSPIMPRPRTTSASSEAQTGYSTKRYRCFQKKKTRSAVRAERTRRL